MDNARLIVGLGNPGREYAETRHNAGFLLLERLAAEWPAAWTDERKFKSRVARCERGGLPVILCQPQTFMNLSGEAVQSLAAYYRTSPERILVAVDDADLPFGAIRLRPTGASGGHHGLDSIERHLGTRDYPRLRIGIAGSPRTGGSREITGYVLGQFSREDRPTLNRVLARAARQVECWIESGVQKAMNSFNGAVDPAPEHEPRQNE